MPDRFERNARTVSLLTGLSRVTGLARDAALSRVFGAGPLMSAFFFAFMIPNLFRRLFGEGALAAAFLPAYARLHRDDPAASRAFASMTIALLVIGLGAVTVLGEMILLGLATLGEDVNVVVWFLMIMLPYMPLVCLVAVLGAMLQVRGRFGPTAAAPIVLNVCLVGATLGLTIFFDAENAHQQAIHLAWVGGALLLAGVLQVGWSLRALRNEPWWIGRGERQNARSEVRGMLLMAGPMILSLGVLQFNTFLDGIIASYPVTFNTTGFLGQTYPLDESAMAVLAFGQRLYQFPLGVFGIAVATAIFPLLSKQADDDAAFGDTLRRGLRLVVFIGLPASAGLILVREPLTAVIYQGGEFSAAAGERVGLVLLGYAPAIWAYSMTHILTRAFYARGDSRRPMRVALCVVALNLILNCILIWTPLREAGLAWSTAICAVVQAIALAILLRRHMSGTFDGAVRSSWGKSLGLTAVMALAVWGVGTALPGGSASWSESLVRLAAMTVAGLVVVGIGAILLRMPEWSWAIGRRGHDRASLENDEGTGGET